MSYEDCYYSAKSRCYDACSGINNCESRIYELKIQKQQRINQINQLNTDIKNHEIALDEVSLAIKSEEPLSTKLLGITTKTTGASVNFGSMVNSDNVVSKDFNDVYGDETTNTKSTLNNVLEDLKAKKNSLIAKIEDLQNQLRRAESELQDIENEIKKTESRVEDWRKVQTNASADMVHYKRMMDQAV